MYVKTVKLREIRPLVDIIHILLASQAEVSYSTRALRALRALRKYVFLGRAPSATYDISHARARAIYCPPARLRGYIYHSAGKHDRGPSFFTLFSFRLIRSLSAGSI